MPLALMVSAMAVLWSANLRFSYDPPWLLFTCNFLFATLASAVVFQLICRSFLAQGTPSLLLLACGIALWGLAGVLAVGFAGRSAKAMLTIHNLCAWLSAGFHLAGILWSEPRRRLRPEGWWLLGGVLMAVGLALVIVKAAVAGWTPLFFVQGEGGTVVRHFVLASSAVMFALSAIILRRRQRRAPSTFAEWYGLGLWLIAAGLVGLTVQTAHGSALGWTARAAGWLGGIYLLMAARAAARDSGAREISLAMPPTDARLRYFLAAVFVAAAVVLRMMLNDVLGTRAIGVTFYPAIILAALYGGRGPGLLAGLLSVLAIAYFWVGPLGGFTTGAPGDWIMLALLMVTAVAISFVTDAMQTARSRASAAEAEVRLADERQRLEQAAHRVEQRLAGVLAGMSDGFEMVDAEWRVTYLNAAARRTFAAQGLAPDQMIGRHLWDGLFPDLRDTPFHLECQRAMRDRVPGEIVNFYKPWQRWYSVRIFPAEEGGLSIVFQDITGRAAAEEARARLAAIVENSDDAIVSKTLDGIITSWNRGAERLFGYAASEIVGRPVTVLIPPERHHEAADILGHIRRGEPVEHFVTVRRRKDGTLFDVSLTASPIMDGEGKIIGASKIARDITAGKKAEEKLRSSEALYRTIGESIRFGVWVCEPDGRNIYASRSFLDLVGLTQEQCSSFGWGELLHPDDAAATIAAWQECVRTGEQWNREHRFRGVDGQWHHVLARGMPVKDEGGNAVQWAGINLDISEFKAAAEALRESEARKNAILDSALDAIITMDHEGRLVEFNGAAERIFGHARAEVLGRSLAGVIIPERLREAHQRGLARFLATGEGPVLNKQIELPALRADGTEFPAEIAILPIPGTQPPLFTAFLRDVTERRALEKTLVARAEQLAQADRRKDEFLAMLAHELRNPLAPLRNAAELLKADDASPDERAQAQRVIARQIENMSRMLEDLLDVSRITAGKIEMRRKPVPLEGILTAAASLVRSTCAAHQQDLAMSLPKEPVYLYADATRLEQVFGNLLNNACKYSGDGCHISLSAERVCDAEPPEVVVTVRDDGAGIAPELLPHIFDLFVQASRTLDRSHGGLGIGLTLVQRLVKLHGGRIEAHSEGHGHGAEFVVHLPILTEAPPPEPLPAEPSAQSSSRGPARRILIVDDNTDSARSLATLQKRRGHETRTAFTGPEAVTVAAEFLPEVVLLDIGLPGMDGFEVARKIRAIPALAEALLIAMSGYGREEDRAEATSAGFDEYMVKPVDLAQLREWLAEKP